MGRWRVLHSRHWHVFVVCFSPLYSDAERPTREKLDRVETAAGDATGKGGTSKLVNDFSSMLGPPTSSTNSAPQMPQFAPQTSPPQSPRASSVPQQLHIGSIPQQVEPLTILHVPATPRSQALPGAPQEVGLTSGQLTPRSQSGVSIQPLPIHGVIDPQTPQSQPGVLNVQLAPRSDIPSQHGGKPVPKPPEAVDEDPDYEDYIVGEPMDTMKQLHKVLGNVKWIDMGAPEVRGIYGNTVNTPGLFDAIYDMRKKTVGAELATKRSYSDLEHFHDHVNDVAEELETLDNMTSKLELIKQVQFREMEPPRMAAFDYDGLSDEQLSEIEAKAPLRPSSYGPSRPRPLSGEELLDRWMASMQPNPYPLTTHVHVSGPGANTHVHVGPSYFASSLLNMNETVGGAAVPTGSSLMEFNGSDGPQFGASSNDTARPPWGRKSGYTRMGSNMRRVSGRFGRASRYRTSSKSGYRASGGGGSRFRGLRLPGAPHRPVQYFNNTMATSEMLHEAGQYMEYNANATSMEAEGVEDEINHYNETINALADALDHFEHKLPESDQVARSQLSKYEKHRMSPFKKVKPPKDPRRNRASREERRAARRL